MSKFEALVGRSLVRWVSWVQKRALLVVLAFVPLTAATTYYVVNHLKLETDYADLISDDLDFHARWVEYKTQFPNVTDTLWVVIEGGSATQNHQRAADLIERAQANKNLFPYAYNLTQSDDPRGFLELRPDLNFNDLLPGEASLQWLQREMRNIEAAYPGAQVAMTGAAALAYEEMQNIARAVGVAGVLSFLITAILLWMGLGSIRMAFITMMGLVVGLVFTGAFAAVSIGYLNMISIAFAVLFIGLGLDYSLHLFLRYREFLTSGASHDEALKKAVSQVGQSLWLCAITTCAGFYAFVPTDYKGVAQLGIISGTGMFINFFIQISLLPALVHLFPHRPGSLKPFAPSRVGAWFTHKIQQHAFRIRWASLAVGVLGIWAATHMQFDPNPLSLQDPNTQALKTYEKLMNESDRSPWTAKILEGDRARAEKIASELQKLPEVAQVLWAGSLGAPEQYLPKEVLERFKNSEGTYRLEVFAKENLNDLNAMRRFKDAILPIAPNATDDPVTIPLTADAVVEAFAEAGVLALVLTFLVIFWSLAKLRDTVFAMTPLVLGGLLTIIVMKFTGQDFNFANIVVLPLLLGIAMDSGIHVIHRYRLSSEENPIAGSTSRAMFFSALVNISSFGTLALAAHRGMSSMGVLLSLGLAFMLICTFVVLPALIRRESTSSDQSEKARLRA
jgi:predicted RND superfamily exporter protein